MEKQKMKVKHPASRCLLVTLLYLLLYTEYGFTPDFVLYALFCAVLASISMIDRQLRLIPDALVLAVLVIGIAACLFSSRMTWQDRAAGGMVAVLPLIIVLRKGGMGGGDIKLMAAGGIVLGFRLSLISLLLACILGVVYAAITKRRGFLKTVIPFGPCLAAAMCFSVLAGNPLLNAISLTIR